VKTDYIRIEVEGSLIMRRVVIDMIYRMILDEEFLEEYADKVGVSIRIESSIEPSEEALHG